MRSRWWVSLAIAAAVALVANAVLPQPYGALAAFSAGPFLVIAAIAAWKQLRAPSPAQVAKTLEAVGSMGWDRFSGLLEDAFRRDGHDVTRLARPEADFQIAKSGRTAWVSCKRWKAARTGVEPLRELHHAREAAEVPDAIYIALGELTDNARSFAVQNRIRVLQGAELAVLLRSVDVTSPGRSMRS